MAFKHRYADGWYKNAAGLYVQSEPISAALVAAASTDQVVAKKSDGTLYLTTVSGGGGSSEGADAAVRATPTEGTLNSTLTDHFTGASIDAKWTAHNSGSLTTTMAKSCCVLSSSAAGIQGYRQAVPAGNFTVMVGLSAWVRTDFHNTGVMLYESSSGKKVTLQYEHASSLGAFFQTFSSADVFNSTIGSVTDDNSMPQGGWIFLKVTYDGTSYRGYWSPSGVIGTWNLLGTHAKAAWFTTAATHVGFFVNSQSALTRIDAAFDFFFVWDAVI